MKLNGLGVLFAGIILVIGQAGAQDKASTPTQVVKDISYYDESKLKAADSYQREQCKLDLQYPENAKGFATVVWFHGGGLTKGKRHFPRINDPGIALVAVGYRLAPQAKVPEFIEDAAAATAWTLKNIEKYGGDPKKVFVSGHSAGGYLATMIGVNPKWLAPYGISNMQLAGIAPISGQMTTHFQVKKMLGDKGEQYRPLIDEYAPIYYASANLPPICLITGDRKIEFKARVEENDFFASSLRALGNKKVEFYEMGGLDHGTVGEAGLVVEREFIKRTIKNAESPTSEKK